ncbi:hypothetical protein ACFL4N_04140 [Thermodesulfobacteriota bacterium]
MKPVADTITILEKLYEKTLSQTCLKKGDKWEGNWDDWEIGKDWLPDHFGVYVLWETSGCHKEGKRPVYVGEGILGLRINESFNRRQGWHYAQMLVDERISGNSRECQFWRKLLERFLIVVLEPIENVD